MNWVAVSAVATVVIAAATLAPLLRSGGEGATTTADHLGPKPEDAGPGGARPEDAFTQWRASVVAFDAAPASLTLCRTTASVSVEVDAMARAVLIDGAPLAPGETRALSQTCRVTGYHLADARNRFSGGEIRFDYRERR